MFVATTSSVAAAAAATARLSNYDADVRELWFFVGVMLLWKHLAYHSAGGSKGNVLIIMT